MELWRNHNLHLGIINLGFAFLFMHLRTAWFHLFIGMFCLFLWKFVDLPLRENNSTTQNNKGIE